MRRVGPLAVSVGVISIVYDTLTKTKYRCLPIAYCWTRQRLDGSQNGPEALRAAIIRHDSDNTDRIMRNLAYYRQTRPLIPEWIRNRWCPDLQIELDDYLQYSFRSNSADFLDNLVRYGFRHSFSDHALSYEQRTSLADALKMSEPTAALAWLRHGGRWSKEEAKYFDFLSEPALKAVFKRPDSQQLWTNVHPVSKLATISRLEQTAPLLQDTLATSTASDVAQWFKTKATTIDARKWQTIATAAWKEGKFDVVKLRSSIMGMLHHHSDTPQDLMGWLRRVGFPNGDHFLSFISRAMSLYVQKKHNGLAYGPVYDDLKKGLEEKIKMWDDITREQCAADSLTMDQVDVLRDGHGFTPYGMASNWREADLDISDDGYTSPCGGVASIGGGIGCSFFSPSFCAGLR